jgi:hypothetical protein
MTMLVLRPARSSSHESVALRPVHLATSSLTAHCTRWIMRALAALLMRGRVHAMAGAALCGVLFLLATLVVPLIYIGGAIVALATLKQGPREGLLVLMGATLMYAGFSLLALGSVTPALVFALPTWLPIWLGAVVLGGLRSQAAALLYATGFGIALVLLIHVLEPEPSVYWREAIAQFMAPLQELQGVDGAQMGAVMDRLAPLMTRFVGAINVVAVTLTLLLARWWQAALDNPGGFGPEFRALRVGRGPLGVTLAVGLLALVLAGETDDSLLSDLMGPLMAMAMFQGLAVLHAIVHQRRRLGGWLIASYVMLLLAPQFALPLLSLLGLLDGWMDFRARMGGQPG